MSGDKLKKSLKDLITSKSPSDKMDIEQKVKTSSFSQPIQRLAAEQGLKNDFEIHRYSWLETNTAEQVDTSDGITLGKVTLKNKTGAPTQQSIAPITKAETKEIKSSTSSAASEIKSTASKRTTVEKPSYAPATELGAFSQWLRKNTKPVDKNSKEENTLGTDPTVSSNPQERSISPKEAAITPEITMDDSVSKKREKAKDKTVDKKNTKTKEKSEKKSKAKDSKKSKSKKKKSAVKAKKDKILKKKIAESVIAKDEIVTETLAKLYAEQGYHKKAIKLYEKLSLKYPEKSSFFAAFIADIKLKIK